MYGFPHLYSASAYLSNEVWNVKWIRPYRRWISGSYGTMVASQSCYGSWYLYFVVLLVLLMLVRLIGKGKCLVRGIKLDTRGRLLNFLYVWFSNIIYVDCYRQFETIKVIFIWLGMTQPVARNRNLGEVEIEIMYWSIGAIMGWEGEGNSGWFT